MAIFHFSIGIISRGKGKSAVAAAAYRASEKITNEWDGEIHDYTQKSGVVHSEILLPANAPTLFSDRAVLWNSVEMSEKSCNAQLAREIDAALPIEIPQKEQIRLVREYCLSQFVSKGMCVDFAVHDTSEGNPHCHIMLTMRQVDEKGKWLPKSRKEYMLDEKGEPIKLPSGEFKSRKIELVDWNKSENAGIWRKVWADVTNEYLEKNGRSERIDHRSNSELGIDEIPTTHLGVSASQMESKGIPTEIGELNRNINQANSLIREIKAQIRTLKDWISVLQKEQKALLLESKQSEPANLVSLLEKHITAEREKSQKNSVSARQAYAIDELENMAHAKSFLQKRKITTIVEFEAALSSASEKADIIRVGMLSTEKRMRVFQGLFEHGKTYLKYKPVHDTYIRLIPKAKQQVQFGEKHKAELALWNGAKQYLQAKLPAGIKLLSIEKWRQEYNELVSQNKTSYSKLKEARREIAEYFGIRRCIDVVLRAEQPEQKKEQHKTQDLEL